MTYSLTRALLCCIALLCVVACKQANDSSNSPSTNVQPSGAALREQSAGEKAAVKKVKLLRVQELTSLISAAQTQRRALTQTKSQIEDQLTAYQAESSATLDQLKAEMQTLQRQKDKSAAVSNKESSAKQMDAFSERARNQLEHALAMDQEYQTQLARASDDLRKVDANMAAMQAEVAALQAGIR